MRLLACLIVAPQRGYDEPAILSYAISSFCPTSADGLHYEACQQRQAKEKIVGGFNEVGADNPSQAALWTSCTPIMGESMENAGFAIGSSSPQATEDAKALASACPDATEMPVFPKFWYTVAVDAIEKNGGPSLIDRVAPAGWLIERTMKARWPRCIEAARPYIAKARKGVTQR